MKIVLGTELSYSLMYIYDFGIIMYGASVQLYRTSIQCTMCEFEDSSSFSQIIVSKVLGIEYECFYRYIYELYICCA